MLRRFFTQWNQADNIYIKKASYQIREARQGRKTACADLRYTTLAHYSRLLLPARLPLGGSGWRKISAPAVSRQRCSK